MPVKKRRAEEFGSSQEHGPTMVDVMDRGKPVTASLFIFFHCAAEGTPFAA